MEKIITDANFEADVLQEEQPILVDFWAVWCGPCRRQAGALSQLAEEGYCIGKVDVDQNMALAQQFRVMSIPTLILFKGGKPVQQFVGLQSYQTLKDALDAAK